MLKNNRIYWVVILISALLLIKLYISFENSRVIDTNVRIQQEAERIKVNTLDIIRTLHLLDLGVRGYAISPDDQIAESYHSAWERKNALLLELETSLQAQNFEMPHFYKMRDSVNSYFEIAKKMMGYLKANDRANFQKIFDKDYGYLVWEDYNAFSSRVNSFEDAILKISKANYELALDLNFKVLILLLFLIIPTLFYTAFYTTNTLSTLEKLKTSELEKNELLATQNERLERLVQVRTEEIAAQNEEIKSQNEEISSYNEFLLEQRDKVAQTNELLDIQNAELKVAQKLIESQKKTIEQNNVTLTEEVKHQTESLVKANKELVQNVSQLEQFTFIVSHNLRAPVARILGLSEILNHTKNEAEEKQIFDLIKKTSLQLDGILSDLNLTIQLKALADESFQPVDLKVVLEKIKNILKPELEKTNATITHDFKANQLNSITAYVESILFNLISNAIKYRAPSINPFIELNSWTDADYLVLTVKDNGMGIDLEKHGKNMFNLYKRFHIHVEGKGLGLYLVKTQVILLGGQIEVESKIGEGTVFTLRIKHNIQ